MEEQKCICNLEFKSTVFELADQAFRGVVSEALSALEQRVIEARSAFQTKKTAVIGVQPTLEEKGVSISIGISF